jgi:acetolactate synthase I/III small subunit
MTAKKDTVINKKDTHEERHVLSLVLDNEVGALGRVVGLFSSRGYNIHSLTVSEINHAEHLSRITIVTAAPLHVIEHILTLVERLVPVHKVRDLTTEGPCVEKGLVLVKVSAKENKRAELLHLADQWEAVQVDATDTSFIFQLTDISSKLDEFVDILKPYGIIEVVRTGVTAMSRGAEGF